MTEESPWVFEAPVKIEERTADDVIAEMMHSRSMRSVSKDDAWLLADALEELRHEVTEERQQTRFAAEEAASRLLEAAAVIVQLQKQNDTLHVAYIQASNPGADIGGIRKTLADMRLPEDEAVAALTAPRLRPGYCAIHDTPVGIPERPVCPHCEQRGEGSVPPVPPLDDPFPYL